MRVFGDLFAGKTINLLSVFTSFTTKLFVHLNYKFAGLIFLVLLFLFFEFIVPSPSFAFDETSTNFHLATGANNQTQSVFSETTSLKTEVLGFKTKQIADPNLPEGETKIIQAGVSGQKVIQTKITYHNGQKYQTENTVVSETKPTEEVLAISEANSIKELQTPYGLLKYKTRLNVWATSYDPFCNGCNSTTSIGLKAGYGVIAVDPKVIPLRSKVYVPGYGTAIAGDTGGSIKGNKIDLGFDNVKLGNWSARYTDIYILEG